MYVHAKCLMKFNSIMAGCISREENKPKASSILTPILPLHPTVTCNNPSTHHKLQ